MGTGNYLDLIARHEGYRRFPYRDQFGQLTIGYGRNLDAVGISEEEARELAGNTALNCLNRLSRFRWFGDLDGARRAVLIDLAYNLGVDGVLRFREMIAALSRSDWPTAAVCLRDSRAEKQEPRRIHELAKMLETGQWPEGDY